MTEQDLQLTMPDGTADAVLFSPNPPDPLPGVLHLPDIGSIRETHRAHGAHGSPPRVTPC